MSEHSFTSSIPGLVEWSTYYDHDADRPLPIGLYNMVVMIYDVASSAADVALYTKAGRQVRTPVPAPRLAPASSIYPFMRCDWLPRWVYARSCDAIGSRVEEIPVPAL